ncbi:NUDIX hydrolase [Tahibacter amnicola]|uniref:GDP-mannose pyrophosphatase n=1 Tax=Tahibacter amnicola TaxID=2976241 RepID=A0ABY6BBQ0_9GAMM|nr:NUDIX hydrolase [Tahibacter amnicola]UXI67478.1 NUDIX hydrolase [Tahibacter amnicola]
MTQKDVLFNGRWLKLCCRGQWEFAERTNPGGAVLVIAVTPEDKVLFVEQWRAAIDARAIEMPAGLIGDDPGSHDEPAIEAARRELLEETGYSCGHIDYYITGPTSAGMSNETITFVRAWNLVREHAGGGVEGEDIVIHEVPRAAAARWLCRKAAEGYSIDPKVFAGLYLLEHGEVLFKPDSI